MRVALMQTNPSSDVDHNVGRLRDALEIAARQGADVLVTPEMFLSGYAIGPDATRAAAEPIDGALVENVMTAAADAGVAVVTGLPELADRRVFNCAILVSSTGELLTSYRKSHLYGELDRSQYLAGDRLGEVVDLAGFRVALTICFDIEFAEVGRTLAMRGAQVIFTPTANWLDTVNTRMVPTRAEENGVYVVYANYVGREGEQAYCGQSCIVDPSGNDVIRIETGERVLVGALSLGAVTSAQAAIDYLGERRPELYD